MRWTRTLLPLLVLASLIAAPVADAAKPTKGERKALQVKKVEAGFDYGTFFAVATMRGDLSSRFGKGGLKRAAVGVIFWPKSKKKKPSAALVLNTRDGPVVAGRKLDGPPLVMPAGRKLLILVPGTSGDGLRKIEIRSVARLGGGAKAAQGSVKIAERDWESYFKERPGYTVQPPPTGGCGKALADLEEAESWLEQMNGSHGKDSPQVFYSAQRVQDYRRNVREKCAEEGNAGCRKALDDLEKAEADLEEIKSRYGQNSPQADATADKVDDARRRFRQKCSEQTDGGGTTDPGGGTTDPGGGTTDPGGGTTDPAPTDPDPPPSGPTCDVSFAAFDGNPNEGVIQVSDCTGAIATFNTVIVQASGSHGWTACFNPPPGQCTFAPGPNTAGNSVGFAWESMRTASGPLNLRSMSETFANWQSTSKVFVSADFGATRHQVAGP